MTIKTRHELRCFCARHPLLATYGVDEHSKLYIHVRVYKQSRIYGEVIIEGGIVRLRCRECLRWQVVVIKQPGLAELKETVHLPIDAVSVAAND